MMPTPRLALAGLCLGLFIWACAAVPQPEVEAVKPVPSPLEPLIAPHREKAMALEADGDLQRALDEWKIALTIQPNDPASVEGRQRVQSRIHQEVSDRLKQGRDALARGVQLEAKRYFLAALALDPSNEEAFEALRTEVKEIRLLNHRVRKGETLASIAELFYGDRSRSEVIGETNKLSANPKLAPGAVLKIPEIPGVPFVYSEARRAVRPRAEAERESSRIEPSKQEPPAMNPMLAQAKDALQRRQFSVALASVDKFLAENPRSAEGKDLKKNLLYQQGKALLDEKKYADSYQALSQLVKLAPDYQDSSALLGNVKARLIEQHYNEGIRLYRNEKLEQAIAEWRTVLEYDPDHEAAKKNIEQAERLLKGLQQRQLRKK